MAYFDVAAHPDHVLTHLLQSMGDRPPQAVEFDMSAIDPNYNKLKSIPEVVGGVGYQDYVYNIEVEDTHTYFVGRSGIWVRDGSQ